MLFSYFKRINYYEQTKQQNRTKKNDSDTLFTAFMLFTATAVSFCFFHLGNKNQANITVDLYACAHFDRS